jgi:hypothetical protein
MVISGKVFGWCIPSSQWIGLPLGKAFVERLLPELLLVLIWLRLCWLFIMPFARVASDSDLAPAVLAIYNAFRQSCF